MLKRVRHDDGRAVRFPVSLAAFVGLGLLLALVAFARPLDHDESQYVAATMLARHALVYRDFAYLQTPLQPILLAPLAVAAGTLAFPALRLANALFGAITAMFVLAASRAAGARPAAALRSALLLASTDIFLFSATIARNDMLPAMLLAAALWLLVKQARGDGGRMAAMAIGLLLSAATATKLSYAIPALAVGALALIDRRYRPAWLIAGAIPPALLVACTWHAAPDAFAFDVLRFPTAAPEQYYTAGRAWKLTWWARALDVTKFLALGPALLALIVVVRAPRRDRPARTALTHLLDLLIVAGLIAALLPAPTWRQYLLPALPPLFVRLALLWEARPPGRAMRIATVVFVIAGIAPSLVAVTQGFPLATAIENGSRLKGAMDRDDVRAPIATLSPQFVAATGRQLDPRFAAGPFFFRSSGLLPFADEARFKLVSRARARSAVSADPPAAILIGGEGEWTSGDARLDRAMAQIATVAGYRPRPVTGTPFTLFVRPRSPRAPAADRAPIDNKR